MLPSPPSLLLLVLLLAAPALQTPPTSQELQVRGQRTAREGQDPIKVLISEGWASADDSSDYSQGGQEIHLVPGSPLVLTHKIRLVPSGSGACGCEKNLAALRDRLERLEREVSALRERCGGGEGGCCTSKESKGAGCSIKPDPHDCPSECSDQGRCVDAKCVCFPGFSGPDCSDQTCPAGCNSRGRCVDGQCVCDPGFAGPDCSDRTCPAGCNSRGRCVGGQCVCDPGFAGPDCSHRDCPAGCNSRGRCVRGVCVCDGGFTGPSCSDQTCPGGCNSRGRCVGVQCVCDDGFRGPECSQRTCPNGCNNRGRCLDGKCVCDSGFTGDDCSERSCPGNCNSRGRCVDGQCVCSDGFAGTDCSERSCPGNCNSRGRCVDGQCVCSDGFAGADCSEKACPGNCNSRGRCVDGQCVCSDRFAGADCSEKACPGNCNSRGRCVDGQCVCSKGFAGADCSEKACPGNCNSRGRCVDGQCVCSNGFAGADCSEKACPGNCNRRGRCVDGQCVCSNGFAGADCSERACPRRCSDRGRCVNGRCVCQAGFAGPDCAAKACPNGCSSRGRCFKGRCVCRRGFAGPDCSQCEKGMTGPSCDTVMSGVSHLSSRDITEASVTLDWTPPAVQYETYHITFTSKKESDQQITAQVEGSLTSFTQTGLASGQEYTVSISGEKDGRRGAKSSAEFMTLIAGPTNLQVVKMTTTSAVVQWERSQGVIDRYRMTVAPNDGMGRSQEMAVPADQNSAHIQQLEPGRLYDITVVAEKGTNQSEPAATQVTPGKTLPMVTMAALTVPVTLAPGQDGVKDLDPLPEVQVLNRPQRTEDGTETEFNPVRVRDIDGPGKDSSPSLIARNKHLLSRAMARHGTKPKLAERPKLSKKPNVPFRFNATRPVLGTRKVGPAPQKRLTVAKKKKMAPAPNKPKPGVPTIGTRTIALTVRDPSEVESGGERKNAAVMSGTDSHANRQYGSEEPTAAVGIKELPDVGVASRGDDTASVSSELIASVKSQEKKCMNKGKVTHFRLPLEDRGSGCREDGTVLLGKTRASHQESFETDGAAQIQPSPAETDLDPSPDPLRKLLTNTYDTLNISTFSVHLSQMSNLPVDSERVMKQIVRGLKPVSSHSSSSASASASQTSTRTSSLSPTLSSSPALGGSSSSTMASTLLPHFVSLSAPPPSLPPSPPTSPSSSLPSPQTSPPSALSSPPTSPPSSLPSPPSSSPSSPVKSRSDGNNEYNVQRMNTTDAASSGDTKPSPLGKGGVPLFHRTPAKSGYVRHPRPNFGAFRNKTQLNVRTRPHFTPRFNPIRGRETANRRTFTPAKYGNVRHPRPNFGSFLNKTQLNVTAPHQSSPRSHPIHGGEPKTRHAPTRESLSSPSPSSASEESASVEANLPRNMTGYKDEATTPASSEIKQNRKKMPIQRGKIPIGHHLLKRGYLRRPFPNLGPFNNQTPPNLRLLPPASKPLNPASEKSEKISSTELPTTSPPPLFKESNPTEGTGEIREENEYSVKANVSEGPSSHQPTTRVGYFRRPQLYGLRFPNKTHIHLRAPPHRGLVRKPLPARRLNGRPGVTVGSQNSNLEKADTSEISGKQSEEDAPIPTQGVQIQRFTNMTPQTTELEGEHKAPVQTTNSSEEETKSADYSSDIHKERVHTGENTGAPSRGRPIIKQTPSDSRHVASRPVTLLKRQPPTRSVHLRQYIHGSQRREDTKISRPTIRLFDSKTQQTRRASTKPRTGSDISSTGVTKEPLDPKGVTNRTSGVFIPTRDSPEGTYKNLVVTRKEPGKDEGSKQSENKKDHQEGEDSEKEHHNGEVQPTKEADTGNGKSEGENRVPKRVFKSVPRTESSSTTKPATAGDRTFKKVPPGSAQSFQFEHLPPLTEYTVTLLGKSPGLLSRLHKLVISTGPEPPTNIAFSKVTENSLTVSWTKPRTPISGFKVTYTHPDDGEPVSVSVDSHDSTVGLSHLAPGSTYEVSVLSVLGLDESDPVTEFIQTLPDRPTDLRVLNVTDSTALLLWRPALAAVDKYAIVYGAGTGSELRVTVSGNTVEQQLSGLEESTTYTITITSQLGSLESPPTSSSFTTSSGSAGGGDGPRHLHATNVSPRAALLSWKPPSNPTGGYRLTYRTEGQEVKEVLVDASVAEVSLTRLHPGSTYTAQLQAEGGGRPAAPISTEFTTGTLRFPFPTDCSQELLNGIRTSGEAEIFPRGGRGTPVTAYCDMETEGGGWTVFQRRRDGSVDFFRGWRDYVRGFGDPSGEFWLGLDSLHNLTAMTRMSLRVDLRNHNESAFAEYSKFEVGRRYYRLTVGGYSGTAGDSLSYHSDRVFSTKDRDPSPFITRCAMSYRGGWWYKNCHEANLNGLYGVDVKHQGVIWTTWRGKELSIPFTEMKMRPAAFRPPPTG